MTTKLLEKACIENLKGYGKTRPIALGDFATILTQTPKKNKKLLTPAEFLFDLLCSWSRLADAWLEDGALITFQLWPDLAAFLACVPGLRGILEDGFGAEW